MKTLYIYNKVKPAWWRRVVTVVAACQLLLAVAVGQPTDSVRTFTQEHPLVYEDAWDLWPYAFLDENGEAVGYNIDLLRLIFSELDIPYVIKLKPTKVALEDLKSGRSDLMLGMDAHFHNEYAEYGKSVIQIFTHSVVHQKKQSVLVKSIEDLGRQRVIVHKGSFSHHLMIQRGWGKNAIPYEDMRDAVQLAHNDAKSQIVWNTMSLKWLIRTLHFDNLELTPLNITHGEYKFMANSPQLLHRLDSVYAQLNSSGRLKYLEDKWFFPEKKESFFPAWIWQFGLGMVVLILLTFVYYRVYRRQEKRMTRAVKRSNSRLATILKTSHVRIWVIHVATKLVTTYDDNGQAVEPQVSLRTLLSLLHPDDARHVVAALNAISAQQEEQCTVDVRSKDEHDHYARNLTMNFAVQHRDEFGRPSDIMVTASDVTEEHLRQQQVKDTMLRYQSIFNSTMVDTVTYDAEGYMSDLNESASRAFPGGREEALKNRINLKDVLMGDLESIEDLQYTHLTRVYEVETDRRVFNKDLHDDRMYYELQLVPIRNAAGKLLTVFGTGRDVTEMVHNYQQLQRNAEQMEQMNIAMQEYIDNINFVLQNGGVRMLRYSPFTHTLVISSGVGQAQYQLSQERALSLTDDVSKDDVCLLFSAMDSFTDASQRASIKTLLRLKGGMRLGLYFSFVPVTDDKGQLTEYVGMCRDISEIKATEEQLAIETAKAQEVELVKNAFLRNMSYEIRTPLNSVVGFAELFAMEHAAEDENFFIEEIKNNSAHLLKLINDILFLSRLDARMIEFKQHPVDMAASFDSRCQSIWLAHRPEGVALKVENPFQRLVVDIDDQNLGIAFEQIVTNAAEHTSQGEVCLSYDYADGALTLRVQDTGDGISEERLEQIFERFGSTNGRGTGLGLPICHDIVEQMGGTMDIRSTVGQGTTVSITIPCACSEMVRNEKEGGTL